MPKEQEHDRQLQLPETPIARRRALGRAIAELKKRDSVNRWWIDKMQPAFLRGLQVWIQHEGVHHAMNAGINVEDMGVEMSEVFFDEKLFQTLKSARRKNISASKVVDLLRPEVIKVGAKIHDTNGVFRFGEHVIDIAQEAYPFTQPYTRKLKQRLFQGRF